VIEHPVTAPPRPLALGEAPLRALAAVHGAFAARLAPTLSAPLRTFVDVEAGVPEETEAPVPSDGGAPYIFTAAAAGGAPIGLALDGRLAALLGEHLLGGSGPLPDTARPLSAVEHRLVASLVARAFAHLADAWGPAGPFADAPGPDAAPERPLTPGEPVVAVPFSVRVRGTVLGLRLFYPVALVRAALHPHPAAPAAAVGAAGLPVELRAELGRTRLRLADLDALAEGDVIPLGQPLGAPLAVDVAGRTAFHAAAGRSGDRLALQILQAHDAVFLV